MPCANNCKQKGCETCGSNCKRCACACDGIDPALAVNRKRGRQRKSPSRGGREKRRSSVAATNLINAQVTDEAKPTTYGSTNGPFPAAESPKDIFDTLKIDSSWYIRARLPTSAEVVTPDLFAVIVTAAVACCILVCKLLASACNECHEKVIQGMARKVINKDENEEKERNRLEDAISNAIKASPQRSLQAKILRSVWCKGVSAKRMTKLCTYIHFISKQTTHIYILNQNKQRNKSKIHQLIANVTNKYNHKTTNNVTNTKTYMYIQSTPKYTGEMGGLPPIQGQQRDRCNSIYNDIIEGNIISNEKQYRCKIDGEIVNTAVMYILQRENVNCMSWGHKQVNLSKQESIVIPCLTRRKIREHMWEDYAKSNIDKKVSYI